MCSFSHENTDSVKLDLGLSSEVGGVGSTEVGANQNRVELEENDKFHEADWSELTESQLEELVLSQLGHNRKTLLEKSYLTHGLKGATRVGKLGNIGGLILDNKLKSVSESTGYASCSRPGKDKVELKTLRQEKEEVERLKKEKQTLEENTVKKLSEMENDLFMASVAAELAARCEEVSKREKRTVMQLQLWEKQKTLFQEELIVEKRKLVQLQEDLKIQQDLELAIEQRDQLEDIEILFHDGILSGGSSNLLSSNLVLWHMVSSNCYAETMY
ncbi:hypothetical protein L6452_25609 [Arctium lappa]|uniref:Uncharacterized protein n=1 Tax=Arctium lappa TaxID=4217 RepID=A0ACB9AAM2_ARCLA|nr:hypothetical protein L6452_25609 [Arctium lappa]